MKLSSTTYSHLQRNLPSLLEPVERDHMALIVRMNGNKQVAIVSLHELAGLIETVHLLSSTKNANRLLASSKRSRSATGNPQTLRTSERN